MGESSSIMAPSRGTVKETASIKKVTRKTLPLKELPEMKYIQRQSAEAQTVTSSAGFKVLSAGASLSPSVPTTRPLTSMACDETSVLFTRIDKHAFAVSFFPQMSEALLSVIFQIVR